MAVYFVTGNLGGGKSLMAVHRIKEYLTKGNKVATNLDIQLHHMFKRENKDVTLYRLPDKPTLVDFEVIGNGNTSYDESKNGLIVLDECGTWFNSRSWADKERQKIINWFLHARKFGWDIIFIVQNISIVDKQARLALGEHVVYCRRTDRMNIPILGSICKIFWGEKLPLPRVHIGVVKYGLLPTSLTVDTWVNAGSSLFLAYDTKQIFSGSYENGVYSVLSPWLTHGRYAVQRTWNFYMRLTKIYAKKYSRFFVFSVGVALTFLLTEALAYKNNPSVEVKTDSAIALQDEKSIKDGSSFGLFGSSDKPDLSEVVQPEMEWVKVNSYSYGKKIKILHNGVYLLSEYPNKLKFENGWFYARLPVENEDS